MQVAQHVELPTMVLQDLPYTVKAYTMNMILPHEMKAERPELADKRTTTVRFSENNTTHEFDNDSLLQPEAVWYQSEEYAEMKLRSRSDARDARKGGYGCLLDFTFDSPRIDVQNSINAFVRLEEDLSQRGLERHVSRQHGDERGEIKRRARAGVLIHQGRLSREGYTGDDRAQRLAQLYGQTVKSAAVFAQRVGRADQLAAKQGDDSSMALEYVQAHLQQKQRRPMAERRLSNYSVKSQASMDSRRRALLSCKQGSVTSMSFEDFCAAIA